MAMMNDGYKCRVCGNDKYEPFLNGEYAECTRCRVVTLALEKRQADDDWVAEQIAVVQQRICEQKR